MHSSLQSLHTAIAVCTFILVFKYLLFMFSFVWAGCWMPCIVPGRTCECVDRSVCVCVCRVSSRFHIGSWDAWIHFYFALFWFLASIRNGNCHDHDAADSRRQMNSKKFYVFWCRLREHTGLPHSLTHFCFVLFFCVAMAVQQWVFAAVVAVAVTKTIGLLIIS